MDNHKEGSAMSRLGGAGFLLWLWLSLLIASSSGAAAEQGPPTGQPATGAAQGTVPPLGTGLQSDYRVEVGDVLDGTVWQNPDISRSVIVRPAGKISYPL